MRRLFLFLLLALLLAVPVRGEGEQEALEDALGVEAVEEAASALEDADPGALEDLDLSGALPEVLSRVPVGVLVREAVREAAGVLLILLCCAGVDSVFSLTEAQLSALNLAGAAAVSLLLAGRQESLIAQGFSAVTKALDFGNVLLPVLTASAAAAGQAVSAGAKYAAAALFLNVLMNALQLLAAPVIRLFFAASAVEAASGSGSVTAGVNFLRWLIGAMLTCLMLAFTLYITLASLAAGSADAAVLKSAKTAVSASIPVVGGIAADAAGSILAAAGAIRASLGTYGIAAILGLLLPPFLRAGAGFVIYRAAAALTADLAPGRLSVLARRCSDTLGLLLGCLGACGLMLFFSIYAMMGVWSG